MLNLKDLFAKVMSVDRKIINDDTSPENLSAWDSFNGLMLASELEKNFNVKFTMEEINDIKKFSDIRKTLKKHGVKNGID